MGSADRIERERLAKRARILDAARELFVERGVEAVTLREIAQRIEYSTTAIYVQFKDKQDLVAQMVDEDFAVFTAALERNAAIADPLARLDAIGGAYLEFALSMPRHYQLLFMTPRPHDRPGPPPSDVGGYGLLVRTVGECIARGLFRPDLTDPDSLAVAVWSAVHGVVSLLIVFGDAQHFAWRDPQLLFDLGVRSLVRGLLRDPPAEPLRYTTRT